MKIRISLPALRKLLLGVECLTSRDTDHCVALPFSWRLPDILEDHYRRSAEYNCIYVYNTEKVLFIYKLNTMYPTSVNHWSNHRMSVRMEEWIGDTTLLERSYGNQLAFGWTLCCDIVQYRQVWFSKRCIWKGDYVPLCSLLF